MKARDLDPRLSALGDLDISRIDNLSGDCQPGSLFVAVPGTMSDGTAYIPDAIAHGAVAVVATAPSDLVPTVVVSASEIRELLSQISARIVGNPENQLRIVSVTGTNGKTSVTHFVRDLALALGESAAAMGTLSHVRTTPAPPELFRSLREILDREGAGTIVAMEVSSHALDQGRTDGVIAEVAVFTNLSHDHLDYHLSMDNYFAAKALLFTPEHSRRGVVVDSTWGQRLLAQSRVPTISVSTADFTSLHVGWSEISGWWRGYEFTAPVGGEVNVLNLAAAMAAVSELTNAPDRDIAEAASRLAPVPGRYQVIHRRPDIVVDYAHTPDGLQQILRDAHTMTTGRILVVFGCGGDRDREKRPVMGDIAFHSADIRIITTDNSRSEDPAEIARDIIGSHDSEHFHVELDRRQAIAYALSMAASDDVVIIAGKGHESTQTIGTTVSTFSDVDTVRELLESPC
jgi:UDP-N-acetylmuramoyl-L-alanyl-D-glutamate--2,6-diaminopimelate ligase